MSSSCCSILVRSRSKSRSDAAICCSLITLCSDQSFSSKVLPDIPVCGLWPLSLNRRNSQIALFSSLSIFKIWSYILLIRNISLSTPNFKETLTVAIKQGETAKTAIGSVTKTIDSITNHSLFLITKWSPEGEIVKKNNILIITLQTCQEKIYNSKTIDSSRYGVRLATEGQILIKQID